MNEKSLEAWKLYFNYIVLKHNEEITKQRVYYYFESREWRAFWQGYLGY
jgi:hypothetical protein